MACVGPMTSDDDRSGGPEVSARDTADFERTAYAIDLLLLRAGALMEDASAAAASLPPSDPDASQTRLSALAAAGADITALTAAAAVLGRHNAGQ